MVLLPDFICKEAQTTVPEAPVQKTGYLDIKQHSAVRPRKLKTWRRRWIVLTKMGDLSSDKYLAKLDLYDNETKWQSNSADKVTFVLENVTEVQQTKSSTHQFAFEVAEKQQPVLVMSGSSLGETYSWILTLQQIFMPEQILASKGDYTVTVLEEKFTRKYGLSGDLTLSVSPTYISLTDLYGRTLVSWPLKTLKRFQVEKSPFTGQKSVLVIESGPNSPTGQSCFRFHSDDSHQIMSAIKQSVCLAAALQEQTVDIDHPRSNQRMKGQRRIGTFLDNHPDLPLLVRDRVDSESSCSTISQKSLLVKHDQPVYPVAYTTSNLHAERISLTKTENRHVHDASYKYKPGCECEGFTTHKDSVLSEADEPSESIKSCSGINSTMTEQYSISDDHSMTSESPAINVRRLRSISTVVAAIQAGSALEPSRLEHPDHNARTDTDSAIASMISTSNDDLLWMDLQHWRTFDTNDNQSGEKHDFMIHQNQLASEDAFENDYEELDNLSSALQEIHKDRDPDTPPALPARLPSIVCASCNANSKSPGGKARSLFKRTGNLNETNIRITSHFTDVSERKSRVTSEQVPCDVCGASRKRPCNLAKPSSTEHFILNPCLRVGDSNVLSNDVASGGCYSPSSTLKQSFKSFDNFKPGKIHQPGNIQLHGRELHASDRSNFSVDNFTSRRETPDIVEITQPSSPSNAVNNNMVASPLSVFLDNANSGVNRVVTGEQIPVTTSSSHNFTPQPISSSVLEDHTQSVSTQNPQNRQHSEVRQCDNGFGDLDLANVFHNSAVPSSTPTTGNLVGDHFALISTMLFSTDHSGRNGKLLNLDMPSRTKQPADNGVGSAMSCKGYATNVTCDSWDLRQMKNKQNVPFPKISLACGEQIWNQNGRYGNSFPPKVANYTHSDYIVMIANSDSSDGKATNCLNGVSKTVPFLTKGCEEPAVLGTHEIYVQPNHTPAVVKQGQQFANVY